jgi:hypothetical protein
MGVCSDEYYRQPLRAYGDESGYWWADLEQLYVRFVSDDVLYGLDFAKWPPNFTAYVESFFALKITNITTFADKRDAVKKESDSLLLKAQSTDAMEQPSKSSPRGSWSSSRGGSSGDFGNRSRLIG